MNIQFRNARTACRTLGLTAGLILSACQPAQPEATAAPPAATEAPAPADTEEAMVETEEPMPTAVKIGVLNPTTGGMAFCGELSNQGIQLYFDNNRIESVDVELVYADTAGDPQQALDQARRLVEQEEVDFLMGLVNSAVVVPLDQFADEAQVPLLTVIAGAQAPLGPNSSPYVFRSAMANGQQVFAGAAACSYNLSFGTRFQIANDPTGRTYVCLDRGVPNATWVDIWFYDAADGWDWQTAFGSTRGDIIIVE